MNTVEKENPMVSIQEMARIRCALRAERWEGLTKYEQHLILIASRIPEHEHHFFVGEKWDDLSPKDHFAITAGAEKMKRIGVAMGAL